MKCQELQELLFEYFEGSLPAGKRADIDAHLPTCEGCAEAVRRQKQLDARLSSGLRESVQHMTLGNSRREQLLNALENDLESKRSGWARLLANRWAAMTAALGAAVAIVAAVVWPGRPGSPRPQPEQIATDRPSSQNSEAKPTIQIRLPYIARSYTFRQNGEFVVDTFVEQTNFVNVTLWGVSESAEPKANDRKLPL